VLRLWLLSTEIFWEFPPLSQFTLKKFFFFFLSSLLVSVPSLKKFFFANGTAYFSPNCLRSWLHEKCLFHQNFHPTKVFFSLLKTVFRQAFLLLIETWQQCHKAFFICHLHSCKKLACLSQFSSTFAVKVKGSTLRGYLKVLHPFRLRPYSQILD
jgi:hypothetical protein